MSAHDHHHSHDIHAPIEDDSEHKYYARRSNAIRSLLIEKEIVTADAIRRTIEIWDSRTPALGAKVVAKAWVEPDFKSRLLFNAKTAIAELGIDVESQNVVAVANTDEIHNIIVCTLCSCYPSHLIGLPPAWYKSLQYRSRLVVDPRGVLKEFGLELDPYVEVRVYDSTANMRYIVIPQRPPETEHLNEERLAELVTRDSMIGVAKALTPDGEAVKI